jgi:hypothetical protein
MGATTIGQIEDDVRIAQKFQPLNGERMEALRKQASRFAGPQLEDWKRGTQTAGTAIYRDGRA